MKQEYKVEYLSKYISERQQHADVQRLKLEDTHHGYVESRREQVRLQEELAMKEKAIRGTQISMHEMGEMKRAQELRVDEFSIEKLRESHDTIKRLTSQVQELQERMNYLNAAGEAPALISTGALVAREEERLGSTLPMPTSASRPSTMRLFMIPHTSMVGKQRQQISELQFDKFPNTPSFFKLEDKIQNTGEFLCRFSLGSDVMDQRSGDGRFSR